MMSDTVSKIKEKLDIVDFLRGYITLIGAGKNFKALCPFHGEKTPSFMVSTERQTWHCFGCSLGGDIFSFLMRYESLEFYEALKILAEKSGVELKKVSPQDYKQFGILYDINSSARDYYKKCLSASLAQSLPNSTLEYLSGRGLKPETINMFDLGLSSGAFDGLLRYLIGLGFDVNDIVRAGLAFRNERGLFQDRFRNRLMFPIYNSFGKTVGFTARILPAYDTGEVGKYVNSPETSIFIKSRFFYGLHQSKKHIRDNASAFLVEGPMDFLMSWQDGVQNVVATMGTALSLDHLKLLKRLANKLILSFDNDKAGLAAGEKAIDLGIKEDFDIEVLLIPDFKDPADLVKASPGRLLELMKGTKRALDFYFEKYLTGDNKNDRRNIRILLSKIKYQASPILKSKWLKELSERVNINENALLEEMERFTGDKEDTYINRKEDQIEPPKVQGSRKDYIIEKLISLALAKKDINSLADIISFVPMPWQNVISAVSSESADAKNITIDINLIHHRADFEASSRDIDDINEEIQNLKGQLKKEYYGEERKHWGEVVKLAEKNKDELKLNDALEKIKNLPSFDI